MKLVFRVYCLGFLLAYQFFSVAQDTQFYRAGEQTFRTASEAFRRGAFGSSEILFQDYLDLATDRQKRTEAKYYLIFCRRYTNPDQYEVQLPAFIEQYPAHPLTQTAYLDLGNYYYEQGDYENAITYLKNSAVLTVNNENKAKNIYRLGHSYFELEDYDKAKSLFNVSAASPFENYVARATYYLGYIYWKEDADAEALLNLTYARNHIEQNLPEIDEMIIDLHYKNQDYGKLIEYVEQLEQDEQVLTANMYLLLGEAYFINREYLKTLEHLNEYILQKQTAGEGVARPIWYRLGYANFKVDSIEAAISNLQQAADAEDALAQDVSYLLGIIYLRQRQKYLALAAFDKCRNLNFSLELKEKSRFYYVKLLYDLGDYSNVIKEGYDYLADYTSKAKEVQEFISNSYLNTGDYTQALDYLSSIRNRDPALDAVYQKTAFNKAAQDYQDGRYDQALIDFKKCLSFPIDRQVVDEAYYWIAEIYSYQNKPDLALEAYQKIDQLSSFYRKAQYGIGYAYYVQKLYAKAQEYFYNFINASDVSEDNQNDAWARLGDCYFIQKDMNNADLAYREVLKRDTTDRSYIYFQLAMLHIYLKNFDFAIAYLDKIISTEEPSTYTEKAYYYKGDLLFKQRNYDLTVNTYSTFIQLYEQSSLLPEVYSKRALTYHLVQATKLSTRDYKFIIDTYPTHTLAADAIQALQEIHNDGYRVPNLDSYITKFKQANPTSTATIAGDFLKAKKPFEEANYPQAAQTLKTFIDSYHYNTYFDEAYYKLAYALEKIDSVEAALKYYRLVKSTYQIRAVRNTARLEYKNGNYSQSIYNYTILKKIAPNQHYLGQALAGLMKSHFANNDLEKSQNYINLIKTKKLARYTNEALLYQGKIDLAGGNYDLAILDFQKIVTINQGVLGAEAQYLIGVAQRQKGDYVASTAAFIDVKNNYEAYLHWIYKSYLLIAENYIDVDNIFQAKATLNSIYKNTQAEDIRQQALSRLTELEELQVKPDSLK